jgi:hypothetical protein
MSTSIKNGKIVKSKGKYAEIREAARKGAEFNEIIPYGEKFPYISDERIDSLLTRLAREYRLPGVTEGLLILVYAIAPSEIREDDAKLLELASFYVAVSTKEEIAVYPRPAILKLASFYIAVETARNDTKGLLEDRSLALYF